MGEKYEMCATKIGERLERLKERGKEIWGCNWVWTCSECPFTVWNLLQSVFFTVSHVSKCSVKIEVFCWQLESHIHSVGCAGWNCLVSSRAPARPIPQMPPPASRPALFFFPRLSHKYPRAAEQRKITISTHKGAMRLEEQVRVETLVSSSRILRHQPRRYPLMAFLESGMAKDRLELVEEVSRVSRDKLDL